MKLECRNLKAEISMKMHFNTTSEFEKLFKSKSKKNILVNLSGRGDKDIDTIASLQGMKV